MSRFSIAEHPQTQRRADFHFLLSSFLHAVDPRRSRCLRSEKRGFDYTLNKQGKSIVDLEKEHAIETYRSLISITLAGLKTLMLINGGAVVALLAYLGQSPQGPTLAPHVLWSLGAFVFGVFFCVCAFFGSYQTQFALYNESVSPTTKSGPSHMKWQRITIVFVLLSCVAFGFGAFSTVWVLSRPA